MPKTPLQEFGDRVGYSAEDLEHFSEKDPRIRHIERLSQAARDYSIQATVVSARHCNSGYRVGNTFLLDADGNILSKLSPKRLCIYAMAQLVVPVALINERLSEGLDPNELHFMRRVRCPDVGVNCGGYGEVTLEVKAVPRG